MLRSNLLNIYNNKNVNTHFDDFLRDWGGIYFSNAWTPGPDTPRSSGCLFSSRYPKFNGCNTRIKYPYYYLSTNNFLDVLNKFRYDINVYINDGVKNTGLLPKSADEYANFSHDKLLDEWTKDLQLTDNSLTFVYLSDYHKTVSEYNASTKSHLKGVEYTFGAIKTIDKNIGLNKFDLAILFSDHGFKLSNEYNSRMVDRIGENRCKVFLYIKTKDHTNFAIDDRLCSIMDIGVTVLSFLNFKIPYVVDGMDLLSRQRYSYVLIEEHRKFNVNLEQVIEYYGYVEKNHLTIFDCHLNCDSTRSINDNEKKMIIEIFKNYCSAFEDNIKQQTILDSYNNETILNNKYYNGTPVIHRISIKSIIKSALKKILRSFIDI